MQNNISRTSRSSQSCDNLMCMTADEGVLCWTGCGEVGDLSIYTNRSAVDVLNYTMVASALCLAGIYQAQPGEHIALSIKCKEGAGAVKILAGHLWWERTTPCSEIYVRPVRRATQLRMWNGTVRRLGLGQQRLVHVALLPACCSQRSAHRCGCLFTVGQR